MKKKLILVTNDDGIFAPGLKALVSVAKKHGRVIVIAPNSPQSGMGHAITINKPLRIHKVDVFKDVEAYECSGTPVDCVKLAKNVVLKNQKIDLCLSGINHGSNASINILYSGTMSAAMEAAIEGTPSIGFSLSDFSFNADFSAGSSFISSIIKNILKHGIPNSNLLNVNIPKLPKSKIKGIKICRQAEGSWVEEFKEAIDPRNEKYYWLTGKFANNDPGKDTDLYALDRGFISIVPSGHDLTAYKSIEALHFLENIKK